MGLYLSPQQGRTVFGSVTGTTVGKPATWPWGTAFFKWPSSFSGDTRVSQLLSCISNVLQRHFKVFIFLAALDFSCGVGSSSLTRDRARQPLHWKHGALATGPPWKSPQRHLYGRLSSCCCWARDSLLHHLWVQTSSIPQLSILFILCDSKLCSWMCLTYPAIYSSSLLGYTGITSLVFPRVTEGLVHTMTY